MSRTVRVIIVNTDDDVAADLRAVLLSVDGVKIVAEIDEPALLAQALSHFPAELLLIHLDPSPGPMMDVVAPLIEAHKDKLAAVAMTEDRDAELVMRAMRAGMREFLWKPFPPEKLRDIVIRIAADGPAGGRRLGRLFSVVAAGGGLGATQMATNLAVELAQLDSWDGAPAAGARPSVAVVDLDFRFGQVAMQLDAAPTYTIADLCESASAIDPQMIERAMFKHSTGVHVLARPTELSAAEGISAGHCAGALAILQEHYDFVVVDMPSRFDASARTVFDMADTYLLMLQLLVPSVRATDRMLQELESTGYSSNRIRLVCNRVGRESGYLEQEDVETTLRRKMDFVLPDEWKTSANAVNMGAPLLLHAPRSKLRLAYRAVAQALAGENVAQGESTAAVVQDGNNGSPKKGLLSLFGGGKALAKA